MGEPVVTLSGRVGDCRKQNAAQQNVPWRDGSLGMCVPSDLDANKWEETHRVQVRPIRGKTRSPLPTVLRQKERGRAEDSRRDEEVVSPLSHDHHHAIPFTYLLFNCNLFHYISSVVLYFLESFKTLIWFIPFDSRHNAARSLSLLLTWAW